MPLELWVANSGQEKGSHVLRLYKQFSDIHKVCSHFRHVSMVSKRRTEFRMRLVYAHFPTNANINNGGKFLEILISPM